MMYVHSEKASNRGEQELYEFAQRIANNYKAGHNTSVPINFKHNHRFSIHPTKKETPVKTGVDQN